MESLYQTVHTESGKIDADLLFNSEIEFVYRFEAYVNMGIHDNAPSQVLFSSESEAGFQMHGELEGIDQHSAFCGYHGRRRDRKRKNQLDE